MLYTTYFARLDKLKERFPNAIFISVTRSSKIQVTAHFLQLAPSWDLISRHKSGVTSDEEYTEEYLSQIKQISHIDSSMKLLKTLAETKGRTAFLLCYEAPGKFCHRYILADYLSKLFGVEITEFMD